MVEKVQEDPASEIASWVQSTQHAKMFFFRVSFYFMILNDYCISKVLYNQMSFVKLIWSLACVFFKD